MQIALGYLKSFGKTLIDFLNKVKGVFINICCIVIVKKLKFENVITSGFGLSQ